MVRITVEGMGFLRTLFRPPVERGSGRARGIGGEGGAQTLVLTVPDGTTVEGLVRRLAGDYPAFGAIAYKKNGRMTDAVQFVVSDRLLDLTGGRERVLEDGDHVLMLPPFEGGAHDSHTR